MDLTERTKELCNDAIISKKDPIKKDSSEFELKKLELQMNKHLQSKQKLKFKKVSAFNYDTKKDYNEANFGDIVNKEIENKYYNKKWRTLPLYMKWNLVQKYLVDECITDATIIASVKKSVSDNSIDITYDNINNKVVSINMGNQGSP